MGRKLVKYFLDLISFNSPQAITINIFLIFLVLAIIPASSIIYSPVKCVFKNIILPFVFQNNCPTEGLFAHCECPACGMTRGMSRLLHGDIADALRYNRGVPVLFFAMVFVLFLNTVKWSKEYKKTKKLYPL
jgi:hypothetical protein